MTGVRFSYDKATSVPIPGEALGSDGVAGWARGAASALGARHELDGDVTDAIAAALIGEQARLIRDGGASALVYEPETRVWAVLRIGALEREIDAAERKSFLWPRAILPPQIWQTPPTPVGEGVSSISLQDARSNLAEIRWLFVPEGSSILIALSPVPARAVVRLGLIVESMLTTLRVDGVGSTRSAGFDPAALTVRSDPDARAWLS